MDILKELLIPTLAMAGMLMLGAMLIVIIRNRIRATERRNDFCMELMKARRAGEIDDDEWRKLKPFLVR